MLLYSLPFSGPSKYTKSYLRGGRTTKGTNGYLVLKILTKSHLRGGWTTNDTDGYLVSKNCAKSDLQGDR